MPLRDHFHPPLSKLTTCEVHHRAFEVDIVTTRQFNLYAELMSFLGHPDESSGAASASIYVASCRCVRFGEKTYLQSWPSPLTLGQPLPKIPLWLANSLVIPLDLEDSYEQACRDLWIA